MAFKTALPALLIGAALLGLSACAAPGGDYDDLMNQRGTVAAGKESFAICHGHGCRLRSQVGLTDLEWDPVADLFAEPAASAAIERGRIATAIGLIETEVGRKTGTWEDEGGTLNAVSGNTQLDCVDETTNTSIYLTLLARHGYLKWHKIEGWAGRGALIDGSWPHQTAVILDKESKEPYAVDSWFEHNGRAAHVVPLAAWRDGWKPEGFSDSLL